MNQLQRVEARRLTVKIAEGKQAAEKGRQISFASAKPKYSGSTGAASTAKSRKRLSESKEANELKKSKKDILASEY